MTPKTLKQQINKRSDFASAHEEAYLNIMRTAALLSGPESAFMRSLDPPLSPATYNLLRILRGHKINGEERGVRASEIGAQMVVRTPDVTRLVDRLEKQGLATRERCSDDKRVVWVAITTKGLTLLSRIDDKVHAIVLDRLKHMTGGELKQLSALLEKARDEIATGRELALPGCGLFGPLVNRGPEVTSFLADAGHGYVLEAGDVILLPNHGYTRTAMHSVFCGSDETGYSLSLAIRSHRAPDENDEPSVESTDE